MKAMTTIKGFLLALLLTPLLSGPALAVEVDLIAEQVDITMPDGVVVPMWKLRVVGDPVGSPPPVISAPAGDPLIINLTNNLTQEPTSLVINGQQATEAGAMTPVWLDGTSGPRPDVAARVRSFTHEAAVTGGTATYEWGSLRAGTYLIQTGTHPSVQMPMGLYAVLKVDQDPGEAYGPASAFAGEAVLLFSEVDSALNNAVVDGTYGTADYPTALAKKYQPDYFLINGSPYPGSSPIVAGDAGAANPTILRFVNAGSRERSAVVHDRYVTPLATDGNLRADLAPQYSLDLPPGGTVDALMAAPPLPGGFVKISERTLGATGGGMLAYLSYSPAFTLDVTKSGSGTGTVNARVPGGIDCGADCAEAYPENTVISLEALADTASGSIFTGWSGGGCTGRGFCNVTMTADTTVDAVFVEALGQIAVFRNVSGAGWWYLDMNGNGGWDAGIDQALPFGAGTDVPVTGDWNNDGLSDFGTFRSGTWSLDLNGNRTWDSGTDVSFVFGMAGDVPVTGDWNGDGTTEIGLFRNGTWILDVNGNNGWDPGVDQVFVFGMAGDVPVTGDWNGDGETEVGLFRNGTWILDANGNNGWDPGIDVTFVYGMAGDKPVSGDWNFDGTTDIGLFRNGTWIFDANGNRAWDAGIDLVLGFGLGTDLPITGRW